MKLKIEEILISTVGSQLRDVRGVNAYATIGRGAPGDYRFTFYPKYGATLSEHIILRLHRAQLSLFRREHGR